MRSCVLLVLLAIAAATLRADHLAKYDASITAAERAHWAFRPVKRVSVPNVKNSTWIHNPIDAFVLAKLEARGWSPAAPANKAQLLRRLHLDLTGLPPSVEEIDAFMEDTSIDAYERLVDRLLSSPAHGERWARHWLDVARYADTNGYERDADKPGSWRYRDWVIRALNQDKPFSRMIVEQLAGDELPNTNAETLVATGFLRLGPWDDEPADPKTDRFDQLDDLVATTSEAFLGLTLACGRCHNHKFEPLTMHDYYRMVAVFSPLDRPRNGRTELDRPAVPLKERNSIDLLHKRLDDLRRSEASAKLAAPLSVGEVRRQRETLERRLAQVPRGYFLEERSGRAADTFLLLRGSPDRIGPKVAPGMPTVLVDKQPEFPSPGEYTSRRRLTLAQWIASDDNPLTARVIVNRVWMYHFGEALVRTPGDFGLRGEKPTHPELLDWLAGEFVRSGWSMKVLHRLIVTSSAYRMSRARNEEYADVDPENRLLWRFPIRRLEAETIRDNVLAASGRLRREMHGPGVRPAIQRAALEGHSDPDTVWKPDPAEVSERRTIYVHVKRSLVVPLIETLDLCDTTRSAARRPVTTVAPQALMLFNGDFVNEQARHFAERLQRECGDDLAKLLERAYLIALSRRPTLRETEMLTAFVARQERGGLTREETRRQVCRVVLNLNEFVYPD